MKKTHLFYSATWAAVLIWSFFGPSDLMTWAMEVTPAVIGFVILAATYKNFKLTEVTYFWIWFFGLILMIGGKYTYAEVPIGNYLQEMFNMSRNHYDRFGHFFQGFMPAIVARELILRKSDMKKGKMLFFLCVCVAMFVSSSYEIIEWLAAEFTAGGAADFLGLQGDIWDAQKDMLMCLLGSVTALITMSKIQDKQIKNL
ncbi:putative membrane protein [Elusimicrobium minutum Pei191]|uniref:Putative membrane protein n=1 Tax=Elusimicrobium minutum (strain Pei191) TaxID=445932 RepID=B2KCU4_ELUMP|nr:DUF2238 domain-containing protein [Elusimicrobium minutum]ACC98340.1 putative membrane protein [Elusimicrobium minutum Pei191]